ncbi:MAG: hypothetical protein J6I45_09220 [Clostridia bacterium]|nr:hypothetical protein [Clostridia bacterium]
MNTVFAGHRPPFQGVLRPETNQYTPQNRKFCGWAVVNVPFATAPFGFISFKSIMPEVNVVNPSKKNFSQFILSPKSPPYTTAVLVLYPLTNIPVL